MHSPRFFAARSEPGWIAAAVCALGLLTGCASPYAERPTDPPFGEAVRRAVQAQQLPPAKTAPSEGVPFTELEPALDRQQKAKPLETPQNRSILGGASLTGQ